MSAVGEGDFEPSGRWLSSAALKLAPRGVSLVGVSKPGEHLLGDRGDSGDLGSAYMLPLEAKPAGAPVRLPCEARLQSRWLASSAAELVPAGMTVIIDSDESML